MGCKTVGEALIISVGDKGQDWDLRGAERCAIRCCNVKVIYWYKKKCYEGYGTVAYPGLLP